KLVDPRTHKTCELPFSLRTNWQNYPAQRIPRFQDGQGNHVKLGNEPFRMPILERLRVDRQEKGCGPGMELEIPANYLVDSDGHPPARNVDVSLFTIDPLAAMEMPGDYGAVDTDGQTKAMETWGAGIVEISAGGKRCNLRPGARAKIRIPVTDIQLLDPIPEP